MTLGPKLLSGVRIDAIATHRDSRGDFSEIFRQEWPAAIEARQWNVVSSEPGVLRGVHVHVRHDDYLAVVRGAVSIGLCDLRPWSPTHGAAAVVELHESELRGLTIPWGVAHGFYFHEPSLHVYAVSEYFDPKDELGCRWDDPRLGIPWPVADARISARDEQAPSLPELVEQLAALPAFRERD